MAPLSVSWCPACGLSQLDQVVDPELLYGDYPFRAGIASRWQAHCAELVASFAGQSRQFLVDIGSNDGTLLQQATDRGWKVLGIDPCPVDTLLPTLPVPWSSEVADSIARLHGRADLVTATNVFGHVDDARDFLVGIATILARGGRAVIECPHILPLLDEVAFDTIYHEHLSYWSLRPLELLAESVGLKVVDVELFPTLHGGTMRYVLTAQGKRTPVATSVTGLRILEAAHFARGVGPYRIFASRAWEQATMFREIVTTEWAAGQHIWGYGANAKAAVLLQFSHVPQAAIRCIIDDTEAKCGRRMPGAGIAIAGADNLSWPDVLILFSWNNATELKAKARARGFRGRFLLPRPLPHLEDI